MKNKPTFAPYLATIERCVDPETGEGFMTNTTKQNLECGCRAVGAGNLPSPLTVELCKMHRSVNAVPKAVKRILLLAAEYTPIRTFRKMEAIRDKAGIPSLEN